MGIYVWGTGCGASELIERGLTPERISSFVESRPDSMDLLGRPVLPPEEVPVSDCDLMIVTTRHVESIAGKCANLGIPAERCLYLKNSVSLSDRNTISHDTAYQVLGKALAEGLLTQHHIVPTPGQLRDTRLTGQERENDYVRMGTLELLCRRLADVPGAAAELGVYRGQFARCVNRLLPDRTLYLFDSFRGFDRAAGAGEAIHAAHEKTSAEQVLAGLRYFWPRLSPGGYLMLHDWGNPGLPGPAKALERYEAEVGERLPAVPIPDLNGTLVLCRL